MTKYYKGFDWDLETALEYNTPGITIDDVDEILATVPGEHDGASYYWLLQLQSGIIGILHGSCDYTGWDCQSSAHWVPFDSVTHAIEGMMGIIQYESEDRDIIKWINAQVESGNLMISPHQVADIRMTTQLNDAVREDAWKYRSLANK